MLKSSLRKSALLTGAAVLSVSAAWAQQTMPVAAPLVTGPAGEVTVADLDLAVREMVPPNQRPDFWKQPEAVTRLARSLYTQRALAQRAEAEGVDKSPQGERYLRYTRERALTELLMQQSVAQATPSEQAQQAYVRSEYQAHPDKYTEPDQVHVRHILLAVAKDGSDADAVKARASALRADLAKGADFAALARKHSADKANAEKGGDLGFFAKGRMVPAFEAAAFSLKKPLELSEPVRTDFGYHIIQLVEHKPGRRVPMQEMEADVRGQLLDKINAETRAKTWAAADAGAKVDEQAIKDLVERQAKQ